MQDVEHNKFKKMEALYGLSILLALALVVMPSLFGFFIEEPDQRAGTLAEELTHFLADYHAERGSWPLESGNELDLTSLGSRPAVASNTGFDPLAGANGLAPLVEEVPLDPWGRPFRAYLLGGGGPWPLSRPDPTAFWTPTSTGCGVGAISRTPSTATTREAS
jgi:hypothetical protein